MKTHTEGTPITHTHTHTHKDTLSLLPQTWLWSDTWETHCRFTPIRPISISKLEWWAKHTHTHTHTHTHKDAHRQTDRQTDTHTLPHYCLKPGCGQALGPSRAWGLPEPQGCHRNSSDWTLGGTLSVIDSCESPMFHWLSVRNPLPVSDIIRAVLLVAWQPGQWGFQTPSQCNKGDSTHTHTLLQGLQQRRKGFYHFHPYRKSVCVCVCVCVCVHVSIHW